MNQKHKLRTGISLLLVLCMMLSVCPLTAFASKPKLNLVSLGDSMTNGYGHDGYYEGSTQVNGFRQNDVTTTYPYYLKQALSDTYNVNWTALAISCMRTEDVNFLLRYHTNDDAWNTLAADLDGIDPTVDNWNNNQKSRWESTFIDDGNVIGDYFTWNEFVNGRFWDWKKTLSESQTSSFFVTNPTKAYASTYQNAVKNADVITLGTGNANFGVIMLQNITSYLTGTFGSGFKDAVPVREVLQRRLPAEIVPTALEILDKVDALVVPQLGMIGEKAAKVLEIVEYTTVSFMFSYMDMLHAIDELNDKDNLDVIMMGLMNTMDSVKLDLGGGQIFDLGAVVDGITDVLSAYYFVLPVVLQELKGDFENITFYIVPNDDHIEMQVSDMTSLEMIKESNTIRERMIQEVSGMIFDLVRNPLNSALTEALGETAPQLPDTWGGDDNTAYQYREKVEGYEALLKSYTDWVDGGYVGTWVQPMNGTTNALLQAPNDMLACAVYLAFERAIIANAGDATLDIASLMSLMGGTAGLAGMMDPIAGSLTTAFGEDAQTALAGRVAVSAGAQLTALLTAENGFGTHTSGVASANGSTQEEKAANYAKTAIAPMFTIIELTNALNGALGDALVSDNAASLGGLLSLFARMIIGNGIGSHPTAGGHITLFNEIMEVYPDKPAKAFLTEVVEDTAEMLYELAKAGQTDKLDKIVDFALEQGVIDETQAELIKNNLPGIYVAVYEQDDETIFNYCKQLAVMLYDYGRENGYINDEIHAVVTKATRVYNEIKTLAVAELKKFIAEHKAEALIALDTYLVNEGWMSTTEMKELAEKIAAAIAAYEADPEGTAAAMIKELVGYIYSKAVEEGYLDPAKAEELNKLVDLIKGACDYFANTPEEQIKADAIALLFDELDKLTDGKVNAEVYAQVKEDVAELIAALEDITPETIKEKVDAYINSVKAKYLALIDDATHGKYIPNDESYYVALGGDTVFGTGIGKSDDGYFDLILEELGLDAKTQYKNLAEKNLDMTSLLAYIAKNADGIKKADLITYQADATAFILAALNEEEPDWSKYLTAEQIAFVEQVLPVIRTILEDDWTKYADIDADKIVDDIKSDVFGAIDDAIMDAFNGQSDKLNELLSICVAQVKSYVEYIQEQAFDLYFEAVIGETVLYFSLMEPIYEVLGEDWASYADLDVEQIVGEIKIEVLAKAGEVKGLTEEKVIEVLEYCVEKALELHEYANSQIAKLPEYFSDEELAFAQAAFEYVWSYAVSQWPELAELNAEELHKQAYNEIMSLLNKVDNFNYEQYVDLGTEIIEEILNCCVDKAMAALSDLKRGTFRVALAIGGIEEQFLGEALKFAFDYLVEDWTAYVDKSAAWVSNQIKDAVIEEMYKYSSFGKEYVDAYADDLAEILTTCIEEVQKDLQTAQNKKNEALDVLNAIEPFKPYIEKLLFASVVYAVDTAKAVDAIHEINPEATLIVVGMYNPLQGLEIVMNGKTIDVGAYMDYLIDATNVYYTALAVADGEFTFVAVPDTEINGFDNAIDVDALNINQLGSMLLRLNDSMYASADGHEYIFEQIMGALDTTNDVPEVDNRTKETAGTFDAVVSFENNNKTAVVECDEACVVLAAMVDEDGKASYTRLTGKKNQTTGAYEFDLSAVSGEFTLTVALKGDYNLDGEVTTNDVAQANKALKEETDPSKIQKYVFDMNGDNEIGTNDVAQVNKQLFNETAFAW